MYYKLLRRKAMHRKHVTQFRTNNQERELVRAIAAELDRNESDTLRWMLRHTAHELGISVSVKAQREVSIKA